MPLIRIRCPFEGSEISLSYVPGIEGKLITCPFCKQSAPFEKWVKGFPPPPPPPPPPSPEVGYVELLCTGQICQLELGKNVVGLRSVSSHADIEIPRIIGPRLISRNHMVIEVNNESGNYVYDAYLCKSEVNPTFVGNVQLQANVRTRLHDGDIIYMPYELLKIHFQNADHDSTVFQH